MNGKKYDGGKPRYDLVPPMALEEMVKVLTFGAEKYAPDNWRLVDGWQWRYFAAAQRHLWAWQRGEKVDPETGLSHLAHASCCLYFMLELDMVGEHDANQNES